jgi:chaperonin GroEL (HSP60 family)
VTITNDGATILKQMSVIHQASKMVWRKRFFFKKN